MLVTLGWRVHQDSVRTNIFIQCDSILLYLFECQQDTSFYLLTCIICIHLSNVCAWNPWIIPSAYLAFSASLSLDVQLFSWCKLSHECVLPFRRLKEKCYPKKYAHGWCFVVITHLLNMVTNRFLSTSLLHWYIQWHLCQCDNPIEKEYIDHVNENDAEKLIEMGQIFPNHFRKHF